MAAEAPTAPHLPLPAWPRLLEPLPQPSFSSNQVSPPPPRKSLGAELSFLLLVLKTRIGRVCGGSGSAPRIP